MTGTGKSPTFPIDGAALVSAEGVNGNDVGGIGWVAYNDHLSPLKIAIGYVTRFI
jgi:hypothetical protein